MSAPPAKLTLHIARRDDGGVRVWCDELPEMVLSHADGRLAISDIPAVIEELWVKAPA